MYFMQCFSANAIMFLKETHENMKKKNPQKFVIIGPLFSSIANLPKTSPNHKLYTHHYNPGFVYFLPTFGVQQHFFKGLLS